MNWNRSYTYDGVTFDAEVPPACCKTTNKEEAFPSNIEELNFEDAGACMRDGGSTSTNDEVGQVTCSLPT